MDLIVINGYTPPSPSKYQVNFEKVYGAEEQLENGYTYVEQVRTQVPKIALSWTNILESDAMAILNACDDATFQCKYLWGTQKTDTFTCKSPKLTLKLVKDDTRIYDVSLTLEG